jgi:ABC-type transporter Mla MlaB component
MKSKFPELLQTGFAMLMELLRGVRDNMIEIATLAVDIMIKFVNTLLANAVKLTAAAVSLLLSFLGAIAKKTNEIVTAGVNVLVSFLSGISNNLGKVISAVATIITTFITEVGKNLSRIVTAGVTAVISFVEGVGKDIQRVVTAGVDVVLAFLKGLAGNALRFATAAADILIDFLNGMAKVIREKSKELRQAGANIVSAIIDGMLGGLKDAPVIGAAIDMAKGMINAVKGVFQSNSPSKVFIRIGKTLPEGLAFALDKDTLAENSAVQHAERIISAFQDSLSHIPDSLAGMDEFNPVITPVLDLTKVQMASRNLNRLMSVSSITPEVSYDRARLISTTTDLESTSSEGTAYTGPSEITFEQNIYAPEALSTNDIYRNTKSQIVLAKEELGIS